MLVNPLNLDIFNSYPQRGNFGRTIYMCLIQLNGLDCGVYGLEAYSIPKSGFWKVLYCTKRQDTWEK